ncbi:MAG: peptidoglycan D,D-transpeptidase FtsI family protein [Thermoleophilaceae bacterium]
MRLVDRRIGFLFALFLGLLVLAAARAAWLGTVESDSLGARALGQQEEELKVYARRGTITDRNGIELAVSEDATTVFANPFLIDNPASVAEQIAPLLGLGQDEVMEKLSDQETGFVYLRRKLDPNRGAKIAKLDIEGIGTVVEPRRTYPQGPLASQVLGSVGTDNYGLSGLEQAQEDTLHGTDGQRKVVKDATGKPVSIVDVERSEPGEDLRLTIDAAIQERTEAVLSEVGQLYQPRGATAVVLDPRNGEVLAMANWPRVDANQIDEAPEYARQNRAVGFTYEPGSTFKAFTVAGAMEEGLVTPRTPFTIGPTIQVADRTIKEAHDGGGGTLTVADILAQSSNVGTVTIGLKLGTEKFDAWVRRFGFSEPTGIDLPGEEGGIVPHVDAYSGSSIGNLPIGQGLAVTPIQMAFGYSAIANGGFAHTPHVIAGETDEGRRIMSAPNAMKVSRMLEGVLQAGGTASEAAIEGYTLAGKTGTAQKAENGGYSKTDFVASFIGFAPSRSPRLLVSVMVDEPRGSIYGGEVAAPAFEKIASFALPYLKIPPQ